MVCSTSGTDINLHQLYLDKTPVYTQDKASFIALIHKQQNRNEFRRQPEKSCEVMIPSLEKLPVMNISIFKRIDFIDVEL